VIVINFPLGVVSNRDNSLDSSEVAEPFLKLIRIGVFH
jgi:hypothetical protein